MNGAFSDQISGSCGQPNWTHPRYGNPESARCSRGWPTPRWIVSHRGFTGDDPVYGRIFILSLPGHPDHRQPSAWFLAILGHDGTHYTLSHNATFNDFLTNLFCWWPLGLTVSGYRALHYAHHRNTGMEDDPELGHKRMRSPQWDLPATPWTVLRYALKDLIGYSLADYSIIVRFSKPQRKREYLPASFLFHIAATISRFCWRLAPGRWPAAWYFSLVTSLMMFFRLRRMAGASRTRTIRSAFLLLAGGRECCCRRTTPGITGSTTNTRRSHITGCRRRCLRLLFGPAILTLRDLISALASTRAIPSGTALKTGARTDSPIADEREIAPCCLTSRTNAC